jgi:hypothetical protein
VEIAEKRDAFKIVFVFCLMVFSPEDLMLKKFLRKHATTLLIGLFAVGLLIQVIPVDRSAPPTETEVPAPPEVRAILKKACYDCHSNETVWPWYSRIAPVSWLLARDVHEGREHMNYTAWNRLSPKKQAKHFRESWEEVDEGEMPMTIYLPLHPEARLTAEEKAVLKQWALASADSADKALKDTP